MKPLVAAAMILAGISPALRAAEGRVTPDPTGAAMCAEKGEGTFSVKHNNGLMKMRVVCREGKKDAVVRYAWYFDDAGRQVREEELLEDAPGKSRIVLKDYDLSSKEPIATRFYDGSGKLLEETGPSVSTGRRGKPAGAIATFGEYVQMCKENPNDLLYWMFGTEKDPQFFTDDACRCVAERAVRANDTGAGGAWKKSSSLDPSNPKHRLAMAAMQNIGDCLCPHTFPDSRLERLCPKASEIEKAWK